MSSTLLTDPADSAVRVMIQVQVQLLGENRTRAKSCCVPNGARCTFYASGINLRTFEKLQAFWFKKTREINEFKKCLWFSLNEVSVAQQLNNLT